MFEQLFYNKYSSTSKLFRRHFKQLTPKTILFSMTPQQDSNSITNASITGTSLESQARSILASSVLHSVSSLTYPQAYNSSEVNGVVDSTTVLVTARILSKLGRSDLSWGFLRTLFSAQYSNGFLPKLVYLNHTNNENEFEGAAWRDFLGSYPGPTLFKAIDEDFIDSSDATTKIWSSSTIMATPHHATSILETFYLSNQTSEDVINLSMFYTKLQRWHDYLHQHVIKNCSEIMDSNYTFPCILVRHPLEVEIDMKSPVWKVALENVTKISKVKNDKDIIIPNSVKNSFDYPGDDIYYSYLYLLQCLNEGNINSTAIAPNYTTSQHDIFYSQCPFAMIDVGFSAALSKADKDLSMIGQILVDKNHMTRPKSDEMASAKARTNRSMEMLNALWDEEKGSFYNRVVMFTENDDGWYSSNATERLEASIAYNFFSMIDPMLNSSIVAKMSTQILQHSGKFSFDCGDYPLWSVGGCNNSTSSMVVPLVNYRVSTGLVRHGEVGLSNYISNGLLDLICSQPNSDESNLKKDCSNNLHFDNAFNATSLLPLGNSTLEFTLTAAIVLDMLIPDKEFAYESEPPISESSVIFLIAAELVVAIAVGVVCLVLSLNLMHRANADEDGDEFIQLVNEHQQLYEEETGEDDDNTMHANGSGIGAWSLELISSLSPMKWWEK